MLGVSDESESTFMVYPNPADESVILLLTSGKYIVVAYDLLGRKIIEKSIDVENNQHTIGISDIAEGVLVLEVIGITDPSFNQTSKLVVNH